MFCDDLLVASLPVTRVDESDFPEKVSFPFKPPFLDDGIEDREDPYLLLSNNKDIIADRWGLLKGRREYFIESQEMRNPIFDGKELRNASRGVSDKGFLTFENFKWDIRELDFEKDYSEDTWNYPNFEQESDNFSQARKINILKYSLPCVSSYEKIQEFDIQVKYENEHGEQSYIILNFMKADD